MLCFNTIGERDASIGLLHGGGLHPGRSYHVNGRNAFRFITGASYAPSRPFGSHIGYSRSEGPATSALHIPAGIA
jgi:hypothetical protein